MNNFLNFDSDSTPISEDEKKGLKINWITNRAELNELETQNIIKAEKWLLKTKKYILSENFIKELHKKMFGEVWNWAGIFRTSEKNIGVAPYQIQTELKILLDDVKYWIEHNTYTVKEICVRFHHRLVLIHPFPNGNGRLSRLIADLLVKRMCNGILHWGNENLTEQTKTRESYIRALRTADEGDYSQLLAFVELS